MPALIAEPEMGNIQSSPSYAATEVLAFMADPSWEAFNEIDFWAQDAWSIGCILAWLMTGEDPFATSQQEADAGGMLQCLLQRHAAMLRSMANNTKYCSLNPQAVPASASCSTGESVADNTCPQGCLPVVHQ